MDYEESLRYLSGFSKQGAPVKDLSRFSALAAALGDPQKELRCIHIVGTNGKGSVAEYVARSLSECGFKTGRFTSPYILDIRERITLDGEFIPKEDFARLMGVVAEAVERCENRQFSQFELLTAVCFLFFKESGADYCVLEAGIGGTLDCTNIIPTPLVSVFTSIGLDHTAILGNSLSEIAKSKSGIIKGGTVVAAAGIHDQAMYVIARKCEDEGAKLIVPNAGDLGIMKCDLSGSSFMYKGDYFDISMCGAHQIVNALTAIETLWALPDKLPSEKVKKALSEASVPARLERLTAPNGTQLLLDGGHNPQAMGAARSVLAADPRKKTALIGMIDTKDYTSALEIILPCFHRVVFYDGFAPNAVKATALCEIAERLGVESCPAADLDGALHTALEKTAEEELLFVGGSLYMAAEVRARLVESE